MKVFRVTITIDAIVVAESRALAAVLARDLDDEVDVDELEMTGDRIERYATVLPDAMSRAAAKIDAAGDITVGEWLDADGDVDAVAVIAHNRRFARRQQSLPGVSA